jgi:NTP pyrophosphatase (non-canonical NTP hydrolase)
MRLNQEVLEARAALLNLDKSKKESMDALKGELADIANFCMMIFDNLENIKSVKD